MAGSVSDPSNALSGASDDGLTPDASVMVELLMVDDPPRIVLIGAPTQILVADLSSQCECLYFDTIESCAAATAGDRDGAVALLWLSTDESDTDSALGMTCRLFPDRVLVRVSGKQPVMPASSFYAFGFQRVPLAEVPDSNAGTKQGTQEQANEGGIVYEYRLADYKRPPDWLNARYWANPQRFDVLEPEYDDAGSKLSVDGLEDDEDDYEPDEDEYD